MHSHTGYTVATTPGLKIRSRHGHDSRPRSVLACENFRRARCWGPRAAMPTDARREALKASACAPSARGKRQSGLRCATTSHPSPQHIGARAIDARRLAVRHSDDWAACRCGACENFRRARCWGPRAAMPTDARREALKASACAPSARGKRQSGLRCATTSHPSPQHIGARAIDARRLAVRHSDDWAACRCGACENFRRARCWGPRAAMPTDARREALKASACAPSARGKRQSGLRCATTSHPSPQHIGARAIDARRLAVRHSDDWAACRCGACENFRRARCWGPRAAMPTDARREALKASACAPSARGKRQSGLRCATTSHPSPQHIGARAIDARRLAVRHSDDWAACRCGACAEHSGTRFLVQAS